MMFGWLSGVVDRAEPIRDHHLIAVARDYRSGGQQAKARRRSPFVGATRLLSTEYRRYAPILAPGGTTAPGPTWRPGP